MFKHRETGVGSWEDDCHSRAWGQAVVQRNVLPAFVTPLVLRGPGFRGVRKAVSLILESENCDLCVLLVGTCPVREMFLLCPTGNVL